MLDPTVVAVRMSASLCSQSESLWFMGHAKCDYVNNEL